MKLSPLPKVNAWFDYGAHAAWDAANADLADLGDTPVPMTIEDALKAQYPKHGKPTKAQARSFREGWHRGMVTNATWRLENLLKYLSIELIAVMGEELQALAQKYEAILEREGESE